ncbi:hypothetical protein [Sphingopyxis terrae]|uniref:hypothetical protein n=1 Tax=Sphingopyxis terrae TaxID=33052 RepID=UPI000A9C00D0|nr:hypothetical protein [Sphingopyxis terrae]
MRCILLSITLSLSVPAIAYAKQESSPAKDSEALKCRVIREVGSRIPKKVCKTNAEWAQQEAAAREAMANRNRNSHCGGETC